jgi:hypothetical protein
MSERQTYTTLTLEAAGFTLVIALIWADEYLDLPRLFFGAPATPPRLSEFLLEAGVTLVLALGVIAVSWRTNRQVTELETLLMICATCRRVSVDGHWLSFEAFIRQRDSILTSHGVCPTCYDREMETLAGNQPELLRL